MTLTPQADRSVQYSALTRTVGIADLGDRSQLELTGADRAILLHNLCTNDIKSLSAGQGCEAFMTNVQGKILGHVFVFAGEESLVLDSAPRQAAPLAAQLDRFIIREDVQIYDRSSEWSQLLLAGPQSPKLLETLIGSPAPHERLAHAATTIADQSVWLRNVDMFGSPSFLVAMRQPAKQAVSTALIAAGAIACSPEVVECCRIEAGFPEYGRDISDDNLPQEVDRNEQAINFHKGCYLGQETVARIDALGHVNKLLTGVKFSGQTPPSPGEPLLIDGKPVGRVTTATISPKLGHPLALAYLRREHRSPGTQLDSQQGAAETIHIPLQK